MALILSVRNTQAVGTGIAPEFLVEDETVTIGRSPSCDWTLPDDKNYVSSRHCEISLGDKGYVLKDVSTNGTFLRDEDTRMPPEHRIQDGDIFRIGHYEVVAHYGIKGGVTLKKAKEPPKPRAPRGDAPKTTDAPPPAPLAPPPAAERTTFIAADAPTPADPAEGTLEPMSQEQQRLWDSVAGANEIDWKRGGFGEDGGEAIAQAMVAKTGDELAKAFLAAASIPAEKIKVGGPEAIAKGGGLLRRLLAGLVVMVEARARAKAQMGAEATQLQLDGNNPIKFARTPEGALAQLINPTERGFLDAEKAVEDAFLDIQVHQMATLAAIPGALRLTLERFSPGSIKRRAEDIGILGYILPGAREAALWKNYEREFTQVARQSDEAFMEVFAKEFRKAYAKQIAKAKESPRD